MLANRPPLRPHRVAPIPAAIRRRPRRVAPIPAAIRRRPRPVAPIPGAAIRRHLRSRTTATPRRRRPQERPGHRRAGDRDHRAGHGRRRIILGVVAIIRVPRPGPGQARRGHQRRRRHRRDRAGLPRHHRLDGRDRRRRLGIQRVGGSDYVDCMAKAGNDEQAMQQCADTFRERIENEFSITVTPTP